MTRFRVEGDSLPLVPTDNVTAVRRRGRVTEVETGPRTAEEQVTLVVTRTGAAPDLDREAIAFELGEGTSNGWVSFVTEALYIDNHDWKGPIRDAFANFEPGVRQVRVTARADCCPPLGLRPNTWQVAYNGDAYTVKRV